MSVDDNTPKRRKRIRLPDYDYSENAVYFITICTKDKAHTLGKVVGYGACDVPNVSLSPTGIIVKKYIDHMDNRYNNVFVDKYIIMPNHIHMLVIVSDRTDKQYNDDLRVTYYGTAMSRTVTDSANKRRTLVKSDGRANDIIPKFISLFKRYCNRESGFDIWQRRYYDHIIRNSRDYTDTWQYINDNPARWAEDQYCHEQAEQFRGTDFL